MNNQNEFIPVKPKERKFSVKRKETRFPNYAVITLNEIKEKTSKMLTFSAKAVEILELEEDDRIGITRGYEDNTHSKEAIFLYKTNKERIKFISDKGNTVTIDSAKFNVNTNRTMSSKFHTIISNFHSNSNNENEKHFLLSDRYGENYWRLEEYNPNSTEEKVITPTHDEQEDLKSIGEEVEITVD